jgi:hypothetical protein
MGSRKQRLLDNVATGISVSAGIPNRVTVCWVNSGAADISFNGSLVTSLVPGDGKQRVIDGLPAGERVTITATADNTVMEWVG